MNYGIHVDPVRLDRIFSFRRFWTVVCCTLRNQEMNVKCVTYEIGMVEIIHYLLRVDHSSRGIVPSVVCLSVIVKLWTTRGCCAKEERGGNIFFSELATGHLDTRFFLVSLCLKANAETVPNIPSCHYMLLM